MDLAPRLPPITSTTGRARTKSSSILALSALPASSSRRMGRPVYTALSPLICLTVSGKLTHTRPAKGTDIRLASPGVISDSWIITGMPRSLAAMTTGTLTKPPLENTTSGFSRPSTRQASHTPLTTLKGSLKFFRSIYRRSLPDEIAWNGMPVPSTMPRSMPSAEPMYSTAQPDLRSSPIRARFGVT
ncbi:hypothetical protein D3C75_781700 [compost metagenome]